MSHYIAYYDNQVGGGSVEHVFYGSPHQRGHGVGSFLAGLFRQALPLIKRGAKTVGKEALSTGFNILSDMGNHNIPFNQSFRTRINESGDNLKRKASEKIDKLMEGSGYKSIRRKKKKQSKRGRKRLNTKRAAKKKRTVKRKKTPGKKRVIKKKRDISDIFGPA